MTAPQIGWEELVEACITHDSRKTAGAARLLKDLHFAVNAMLRGCSYTETAGLMRDLRFHKEISANSDASVYRSLRKADALLDELLENPGYDPIGLVGREDEELWRRLYAMRRPRPRKWTQKQREAYEEARRKYGKWGGRKPKEKTPCD